MGLLENIKNEIKRSGTSKGKIMYWKEDAKVRVRFLTDFEDGMEIVFHDSFQEGINLPCQEIFGRDCKYCENEDLRTRNMYAWSVWDYEAKEVKLILAAVNNCSPIPPLTALYETYGTLVDRDFVITRKGKQQNTSYAVVPMDKSKFRNTKAKPFSEKAILKILDKAFPDDEAEDDDFDEDESPKKKKSGKASSKSKKQDDDWDEDEEGQDYEEMTAKELYDLCIERDIDVPKKKTEKFYIKKLKEWDEEQEENEAENDEAQDEDDWGEYGEDDEWED